MYRMKKSIIFSSLMLLVILASCGKAEQEQIVSTLTDDTTQVAQTETVSETQELAPGFSNYDESLLGQTDNTVIFFHAEWCGSCKTTEANLIDSGVDDGLSVLKIDFDAPETMELRKKYGVTSKHTFVQVDANGDLIKKWQGSLSIDDINDQLEVSEAMMKKEGDAMMESDSMDKMEKEDAMMKKDGEAMMDKTEHEGDSMEKIDKMEKDDTAMMKKDEEVMVKAEGKYADYNASLVGTTENTVLFFHANWCPSCRAADGNISAETVPSGLTILKTDFDSNTDLKKKYGVVSQHTFVQVDANGELIKKWVGGNNVDDIVNQI